MTRGALIDAIEQSREEGTLAPVASLLRSGYQPDSRELDALARECLGKRSSEKINRELERKAAAKRRYRALRAARIPPEEALEKAAEECGLHIEISEVRRRRQRPAS